MNQSPICGLRGRKREATRLALGAAAVELVSERGLHVTVEQIAERAGVSPRTFFNYFSSKEEAITVGHATRARGMIDALQARPLDENVWESLRAITVEALSKIVSVDASWIDEMRLARANPTVMARVLLHHHQQETMLAEALAQRPDLAARPAAARLIAAMWVSAVRVAVDTWLEQPDGHDLTNLIDGAFATLRHVDPAAAAR